ncbi:MAG: T9SS type A sorting domain-containing protein, partial [Balneolaceae bacterium]
DNADVTWIGGYGKPGLPFFYPNQHPDQHIAVFDHTNPDRVWVGHDGGLSVTNNVRATDIDWEFKNDGYNTTQFYTIALPRTPGDTRVMGGTQDNGTLYINHTVQMNQDYWDLSSGDGSHAHFGDNFAYVSSQNGEVLQLDYHAIKLSLFDVSLGDPDTLISAFQKPGSYWTYVHPRQKQFSLFIHPFVVSPIADSVMFFPDGRFLFRSTKLNKVLKNRDRNAILIPSEDQIWTRLDSLALPEDYIITALGYSTTNPVDRLYWGGSKFSPSDQPKIFRLDSAKLTETMDNDFKDISIPAGIGPPSGSYLHNIAVNEKNGDELIAVFSNYLIESLYHSMDGGDNWIPVQGNIAGTDLFPGPSVRDAAIMQLDDETTLYIVGTSAGVFTTTELNGNNTFWEREAPGQIGFNVADAIDVRLSDNVIAIGTHGRGMWIGNVQTSVSVEEDFITEAPVHFELKQNFPNPFNPSTNIQFVLSEPGTVTLQVFDVNGKRISTIINNENRNSGQHTISFDASSLASGVYFYRINLTSNSGRSFSDVKRMTLIK